MLGIKNERCIDCWSLLQIIVKGILSGIILGTIGNLISWILAIMFPSYINTLFEYVVIFCIFALYGACVNNSLDTIFYIYHLINKYYLCGLFLLILVFPLWSYGFIHEEAECNINSLIPPFRIWQLPYTYCIC